MNFKNFQARAWDDIFSRSINLVMNDQSFSYENISITYTPDNASAFLKSVVDSEGTNYKTLRVKIRFANEDSSLETVANLIDLPLLTEDGLMINGTKWAIINTAHPASGWYLLVNKKRKLELILQRGSLKIITISIPTPTSKDGHAMVYLAGRKGKSASMPLFAFLKAVSCNPNCTYAEIADMLSDCPNIISAYYSEYINISDSKKVRCKEANLTQCADTLLHHITGYSSNYKWSDPVAELKNRLNNNSLRIGTEKIPRFKRFVSFARAKGTVLNKSVTLASGQTISAGEVLTDALVRLLDSEPNLTEISVSHNEREFTLKKYVPNMALSFDEILCVLRVYDQALAGLALIDDPDELYNKIINSIREDYEKRIEQALSGITRAITKQINAYVGGARHKLTRTDDLIAQLGSYDYSKHKVSLKDVYKTMTEEAYYQQFDETNSLSNFDQSYKLTTTAKNVANSARDIHSMQYGRICPYTTSESKQVGLNLALTLLSELDNYGFITTPVYRFSEGHLAAEPEYVSAIDELTEVIAPAKTDIEALWREHANDSTFLVPDCRINGQLVSAPITDVTAKYVTGLQAIGPLPAAVPAANMNSPKRLIMCASAQRQALVPLKAERPLVTTGIEGLYEIGVTTADTLIRDYLIAHGKTESLAEDACVFYDKAYKSNNKLYVSFIAINNGMSYTIEKCFDNCKSTLNGSVKYLRLAPPQHIAETGRFYKGNDVIFYNSDVDMTAADFAQSEVNFGTIKFNSAELQNHGVAIGNNCKVLFKSFDGYTYEDSIEVTESFLARRGLSVIKTTTLRYILHKSRKEHVEFRSNEHGQIPQLDSTGYPISGFFVQTGQDILATVSTDEKGVTHTGTKKIGIGQSGFVIGHKQFQDPDNSDNVIVTIDLGDILDVTRGDKLEGLHGNKGVIGRILKDSEVPYTEDGEVPDLILNPLGILARLNLGQIPEFTLGGISEKTGKVQILEPFADKSVQDIAEMARECGLVEKDIYDARTGLKYPRKAMMGNMYMLRLEHISTSKYNATSDCKGHISARTGQPQGSSGGGQRMSELCTWCVTAYGATTALDSFFTAQSDAIAAKSDLDKAIKRRESTDIKYKSNNLDFLQAYFHMLGAHLAVDERVRVELLTQKYMDKLYPNKCRIDLLHSGSMTPKALLHDSSIFGDESDKETNRTKYAQLPFSLDDSCKLIMPMYLKSESVLGMFRYAYYKDGALCTDCKVPHNSFFNDIIDGKLCILDWHKYETEEVLKKLVLEQYGVVLPDAYELPIIAPVHISKREINTGKSVQIDNELVTTSSKRTGTGIRAVVSLFERYDIRASLCRKVSGKPCGENTSLINKKEFPHLTDIVLFMRNYSLADFIVTGMLIPPVGYRSINMADAKMSNPIDAKLNDVVSAIRLLCAANIDSNRARRETELYHTLNKITFEAADSTNPSLKDQLVDHKTKSSIMRDTLLSKRLSYTGRSVITIGSDLEFGECGVPISMLTTIFESHIAAEICDVSKPYMMRIIGKYAKNNSASYFKHLCEFVANNNLHGFQNYTLGRIAATSEEALAGLKQEYESVSGKTITLDSVADLFDVCYSQLIDILKRLLKTHPTLLNREPSLHKFSIQGFRVVPVDSDAIQLHPLNCHGFNGDYDGDQMAALFAMVESAIQDILAKMMAEDNIIDPKDGSGIIELNQDIILGLYYATIHKNNAMRYSPKCISAVYTLDKNKTFAAPYGKSLGVATEIMQDISVGLLNVHDTIMCIYNNRKYIAEAGRFIVNAILPGGIGFTTKTASEILGYKDTYALAVDYVLSKKTIGTVEKKCIDYFSKYNLKADPIGDTLGAAYNRLMRVGFRMADLSGITLSIYDLVNLPVKGMIGTKIESTAKAEHSISEWYNLGFCTEADKDTQSITQWRSTTKSLQAMLNDAFTMDPDAVIDGPRFDRMSNIFMIIDSGARGNVSQLLEMSGLVGVVTNSAGKAMTTPVRRSYMDGLTPEQFMQNAYNGRRQTAATQLTTADAGEFNRHCIYLAEHLHIRPNGKRCDAKGTWIPLEYEATLCEAGHSMNEYKKHRLGDHVILREDEMAQVPENIWKKYELCCGNAMLAMNTYRSYTSSIQDLLLSNTVSSELKHLLTLNRVPFIITQDSEGEYHFIEITYTLSEDSRSMLYYRVLDVSELEANSDTEGYAIMWRSHSAAIAGDIPEELGDDIVIGDELIHDIELSGIASVPIFTILGCKSTEGICQCCFGVKYDSHTFPEWGESIGYQAVQAVGNPITQIILDSHKSQVSDEESAETKLNRILSNNHSAVPAIPADILESLPIAVTDEVVHVNRNDSDSGAAYVIECLNNEGSVIQNIITASLEGLKVFPGTAVSKGQPIFTTCADDYRYWMSLTDSLNIRIDIWQQLCKCFSNDTICARNFEVFADSLTEFGRAETTDLEHGIVRNGIYRTAMLDSYGIKYIPEFLSMRNAMNKSNKVLADIALSNACENISSAVVTGAINSPDSNVGASLIGNYKTASGKLRTESVIGQFTSPNKEAFKAEFIIKETHSLIEERTVLAEDAYEDKVENNLCSQIKRNTDFTTFAAATTEAETEETNTLSAARNTDTVADIPEKSFIAEVTTETSSGETGYFSK